VLNGDFPNGQPLGGQREDDLVDHVRRRFWLGPNRRLDRPVPMTDGEPQSRRGRSRSEGSSTLSTGPDAIHWARRLLARIAHRGLMLADLVDPNRDGRRRPERNLADPDQKPHDHCGLNRLSLRAISRAPGISRVLRAASATGYEENNATSYNRPATTDRGHRSSRAPVGDVYETGANTHSS
jgi:hypothetical protein